MPATRSCTVKESKKPKVLIRLRVNLNNSTVAEAAGQALAKLIEERKRKQDVRARSRMPHQDQ